MAVVESDDQVIDVVSLQQKHNTHHHHHNIMHIHIIIIIITHQSIVATKSPTILTRSLTGNRSKYGIVAKTCPNGLGNMTFLEKKELSENTGAVASNPSGE